ALTLALLGSTALVPSRAGAQEPAAGPDVAGAYARSFTYERTQAYDDAIRALAPVYDAVPNGYTVNLRMGWLFYLNGNYSNSITHYEVAEAAAPGALEPRLGHLLPLLAQERWADAEALGYQVVSADHFSYYGNLRLAIALRMQGKLDAAYQVALKMITAYPTDVLHLVEFARIVDARGDAPEAARLFREILILDPENEAARQYLGG
ncbi:MAG: hypothetical protein P8188_09785, partial [Gemmatimonadota bacterium]